MYYSNQTKKPRDGWPRKEKICNKYMKLCTQISVFQVVVWKCINLRKARRGPWRCHSGWRYLTPRLTASVGSRTHTQWEKKVNSLQLSHNLHSCVLACACRHPHTNKLWSLFLKVEETVTISHSLGFSLHPGFVLGFSTQLWCSVSCI